MRKTLLQVGDKVHIREDISERGYYEMKTYSYSNCYLEDKMAKPGELVTIGAIKKNGYQLIEEDFFTYTDEMFDLELINFLYEEFLENEKEKFEEFMKYQNK